MIADDVYNELKSCQGVRMLTGSAYGIQDAFMVKLIESIDNSENEIEIKHKEKNEKRTRSSRKK